MTIQELRAYLASTEQKDVILDTDAFNEIDDQFCIAYLMKRQKEINLLGMVAAPFFNENSTGAGDGMEKSYHEILKVQKLTDPDSKIPVFRGANAFLTDRFTPAPSEGCDFIIETVMSSKKPVLILAIGAITNVASALLKCPEIASRAAVIWLGGHATHLEDGRVEFNLRGDIPAAQTVFDSKIPLVQIPCRGVCSIAATTWHELEYYLRGKNAVCDYLTDNVKRVSLEASAPYAKSRVIWDVSAGTVLLCPDALTLSERPCPVILDNGTYRLDADRHPYLYVAEIRRDAFFADLFRTLTGELA